LIPNKIETVRRAKQDVIDAGINPDASECARFEITKRVAAYLNVGYPEVGLLYKPDGNNCDGFAVDVICLKDGTTIDLIGKGNEGPNTPLWIIQPFKVDVNRWRAPVSYQLAVRVPVESIPTPISVPIETKPIEEAKPDEAPEIKISKVKALGTIAIVMGALRWLYNIVKKSDVP
jgi:hypothetical protein